ncbi:ankyrin repeat domain-containing protein [Rhodopirellula sp. MGV]|uniref:ankyrin repeat domain-containing protein n=1 Tax=Rhodopirellula sp. MGV TaxID=2023130 RepID=UPI000B9773A6|nr:ankyrin repeat domain-containing protein [Rhodopirellula sp. MGV]OYP28952.1 hypothetical protein CGZ80_25655 [Rhodopirellula sp. MGV]PNY36931.1 hypothetical protein C2E31_09950 [Rhodopirellula baltica]
MNQKALVKAFASAIRTGNEKAVQNGLLDGFPINERLFDGGNRTALQFAIQNRRYKIALMLLDHGADPDAQTDQFQATALCEACEEGDLVAAKLLLDAGASPDIPNEYGITPLMEAASAPKNAQELVAALLAHHASVGPNKNGRNALHSKITDPKVVDCLVEAGADVNAAFHGSTPLMKAMESPQPKANVIAALVSHGAGVIGCTAIEFAREKQLPPAFIKLLDAGGGSAAKKKAAKKKAAKKKAAKKKAN